MPAPLTITAGGKFSGTASAPSRSVPCFVSGKNEAACREGGFQDMR